MAPKLQPGQWNTQTLKNIAERGRSVTVHELKVSAAPVRPKPSPVQA